jgi:NitT/TauT family transport system substrate-binding protein
MKSAVSGYLAALYEADPASVGGALPDDGFYLTDEKG